MIARYNHRRLYSVCGGVPPIDYMTAQMSRETPSSGSQGGATIDGLSKAQIPPRGTASAHRHRRGSTLSSTVTPLVMFAQQRLIHGVQLLNEPIKGKAIERAAL